MSEPSGGIPGYDALKQYHSRAYEYLSKALAIDESGQGKSVAFPVLIILCLCTCVYSLQSPLVCGHNECT